MRCQHCDSEFSDPRHPDRKYCSLRCSGLATARQRGQETAVERPCACCGKPFRSMPSAERQYCSRRCANAGNVKDRPKCEVCGKPVRLMRNRYCSKSCSNAARPRPGVTSMSGIYARAQKANPSPAPCAVCGGQGEHRHHNDYSKPEDVVWLCAPCHRRHHQLGKSRGAGEYRARPETILLK